MRVALLAYNAPLHNAVGNQIAEKVRFFQERGAEVRLFVQDARKLHPDVHACAIHVPTPSTQGFAWEYLQQADLIFTVYAQHHDLLQFLPLLAGTGPRIVFDYLGVTPPEFWDQSDRARLEPSIRQRGYVWWADHALTMSQANRRELVEATNFPAEHVTTLPLPVDVERFRPGQRTRFFQRELGIEGRIVLFVGRLAANKRAPLLIEALARLADPSVHAVLVGDCSDIYAEEAGRCLTLAQQLGVERQVHLVGDLSDDELASAYRDADVLAMPSLHEGFCVPVVEAMASGCPVIASRCSALPETVGDAGLTFTPNDADDLTRQLRRILDGPSPPSISEHPRRVAIVSFRFGPDIIGGAESSMRTLAKALQDAGHHVEIFTTCATSESNWTNDVTPGTATLAGLTVHRFSIDAHDSATHGEIVRTIVEGDGDIPLDVADRYVEHSIHSRALLDALRVRRNDFDVIITGPYLFGLTADIAREFPERTLVVPCFHDEAIARLPIWPRLFSAVGGVFYHSVEEKAYAEARLGVNHPNSAVIGTCLAPQPNAKAPNLPRPYVVYCGRYSAQKNVPLLVELARHYQACNPGQLDVVFMGTGEIKLPREPGLHDLGQVDENVKWSVLAGAKALVQLSRQESLSLVALEAWSAGTPVIAHADCAVLAGQIERSQGGVVVPDRVAFCATLDDLLANESAWRRRGDQGRDYVAAHYVSDTDYVQKIVGCIDRSHQSLRQQMRERGLQRAQEFARPRWQARFAEFVEYVLTQPPRPRRDDLRIEPLRTSFQAAHGVRSLLLPVRLTNAGTHAAAPDGFGRTVMLAEVLHAVNDRMIVERAQASLPALLLPGQTQIAALPITLLDDAGEYRIRLWLDRVDCDAAPTHVAEAGLTIAGAAKDPGGAGALAFLDAVAQTLPQAHRLQQLPADYVDVTEGRLASVKRAIKRKLLHNFKHGYVDVLSRQQSQVNGHLVTMIQQLAECCAMLDHAVAGLHQRIDALEAKMKDVRAEPQEAYGRPHG